MKKLISSVTIVLFSSFVGFSQYFPSCVSSRNLTVISDSEVSFVNSNDNTTVTLNINGTYKTNDGESGNWGCANDRDINLSATTASNNTEWTNTFPECVKNYTKNNVLKLFYTEYENDNQYLILFTSKQMGNGNYQGYLRPKTNLKDNFYDKPITYKCDRGQLIYNSVQSEPVTTARSKVINDNVEVVQSNDENKQQKNNIAPPKFTYKYFSNPTQNCKWCGKKYNCKKKNYEELEEDKTLWKDVLYPWVLALTTDEMMLMYSHGQEELRKFKQERANIRKGILPINLYDCKTFCSNKCEYECKNSDNCK